MQLEAVSQTLEKTYDLQKVGVDKIPVNRLCGIIFADYIIMSL
jgi:hypothetical protein